MRLSEGIQVRSNLILTVRERGKLVRVVKGHNIWLNLGREYLASLICYSSYTGSFPTATGVPERNDRIQYMGLGIGGSRQLSPAVANSSPLTPAYAGTNVQTDTDPTVTSLERPVRISGASDSFPYADPTNIWLGQVQAPVLHPTATQSTFKRLFATTDVSYTPFLSVPLSEIALFTGSAAPGVYNNNAIAYDTFDTVSKTSAFSLEIDWSVRF
jgi:hypothetical protein